VRAKEYKKKRKKLSEERFGLGKSENFFSVQKARTSVMRNVVARPFSKTKSITLADFFAFCFLLLSLSFLVSSSSSSDDSHSRTSQLSLSLFPFLSSFYAKHDVTITMFARGEGRNRRRRTDEENEEDEKEEESALSVGTAFGKIWECYCALSCLFFFSLLRSLSLSPVSLFSGKCCESTKSFL